MADIISGTEMRAAILDELRQEVEAIREKHGTVPGLVTILVGENPASISYVTLKVKTALSLGFHEIQDNQPADVSEEALLALIDKYNRDPSIHGILVQLPLPKHIDENKVIYAIDPDKDVDGFHPVNLGVRHRIWLFKFNHRPLPIIAPERRIPSFFIIPGCAKERVDVVLHFRFIFVKHFELRDVAVTPAFVFLVRVNEKHDGVLILDRPFVQHLKDSALQHVFKLRRRNLSLCHIRACRQPNHQKRRKQRHALSFAHR